MSERSAINSKVVVCDYLHYRLHAKDSVRWVKLPLVELRMRSPSAEFGSVGLVDSGSDRTFVPKEEAELLGLKPQTLTDGTKRIAEALGAGGSFLCEIMALPEMRLMWHRVQFQDFHGLSVWVPQKNEDIPYTIIGRDIVFKRFEISFNESHRKITFRRV